MIMTMFTGTVLVMGVIMQTMNRLVDLLLVLKAESHSSLVPRCQVEPVLFLQLPSGFVPLSLQLSQCSSDKLFLWRVK